MVMKIAGRGEGRLQPNALMANELLDGALGRELQSPAYVSTFVVDAAFRQLYRKATSFTFHRRPTV
jgi:hypothetical protein